MRYHARVKNVCVFCGSSAGSDPAFRAAACEMGEALVRRGIGLVYGGARIGMMGAIADRVLELEGEVIGVIPRALAEKEVAHAGLSELHIVGSMHERKALLTDRSDAFIAMPGGYGTLDELCEALTWGQLGIHAKPVGLLSTAGYFDRLLAFLDHARSEGFLQPEHRAMVTVSADPDELLNGLSAYTPPGVEKLIGLEG
ncbi:MAG: TIGR00730 family Rossman fold protein [Vicinamibacterales bacterium]|nr:TIGR00730 family Rossman fold protein [Vicinamibacterales bacterium]MDP6610012.1 TIGR00730 family Rossman fold protein [Vicinamibacterales bacterium]